MNITPKHGYWLFKSCLIELEQLGAESSTKFVFDKLGVRYYDDPRQSCCTGMGVMTDVIKPLTTAALAVRNFTLAEETNHPYISTICSTCYGINKEACEWLHEKPHFEEKVAQVLSQVGIEYDRKIMDRSKVFHVVDVLLKWKKEFKKHITVDLSDLKVATHHGCHYFKIFYEDVPNPENPTILERLVDAVEAEPIEWYSKKLLTCGTGFRHRSLDRKLSRAVALEKLRSVKEMNADILVTMCPMCAFQFDRYDPFLMRCTGENFDIVHLNIAQLVALAFGADPYTVLGIQMHSVRVEPLLKKLGVLRE